MQETLSAADLASYLMYPKVFSEFVEHRRQFGDVSTLPTSVFFYGLREQEEVSVAIDTGKTLVIRLQGSAEAPEEGVSKLFFELNGQPRLVRVPRVGAVVKAEAPKADDGNTAHVGAPMPGMIVRVAVQLGQAVTKGEPLLALEAMKMEAVLGAPRDGKIKIIHAKLGGTVNTHDLLIELE